MNLTVVDTTYYDLLNVSPDASSLELKRAYRRAALNNHPDKNLGDEEAKMKFQEIGRAYQVLNDPILRKRYDELGLADVRPEGGFEDPIELFSRIFGGDSFREWIGELSYLKNAAKMMEIRKGDAESDAESSNKTPGLGKEVTPFQEHQYHSRGGQYDDVRKTAEDSRPTKKKATLTRQQKEQLEAHKRQKEENHKKRVSDLSTTILWKIKSIVEYPNDGRAIMRFRKQIQEEASLMKLESFGDQLLHTLGELFVYRGNAFLTSIPIVSSVYGYFADRRMEFKDSVDIISSGLDARNAVTAMQRAKEDSDRENQSQHNEDQEMKKVAGKVLAACWKATIKEVHDIAREVCDLILYEKDVSNDCRSERASALILIGEIFSSTAREPGDEVTDQIFEILVAEASKKT